MKSIRPSTSPNSVISKATIDGAISELRHDAASLAITILKKKLRGQIFLGCDNHPLSRQEVMDLVTKSGKFSKKFEAFTGTSDPLGKRLNNSKTRKELGWEPRYPSFANFLGLYE
uniref:NAD(P)-binding domain-containing protein n=1 Tax=Quercus lobata TaxID=97700 RepID=A0A7N2LW17_QUELO